MQLILNIKNAMMPLVEKNCLNHTAFVNVCCIIEYVLIYCTKVIFIYLHIHALGGMVVQWLAQSPYSRRVLGQTYHPTGAFLYEVSMFLVCPCGFPSDALISSHISWLAQSTPPLSQSQLGLAPVLPKPWQLSSIDNACIIVLFRLIDPTVCH